MHKNSAVPAKLPQNCSKPSLKHIPQKVARKSVSLGQMMVNVDRDEDRKHRRNERGQQIDRMVVEQVVAGDSVDRRAGL